MTAAALVSVAIGALTFAATDEELDKWREDNASWIRRIKTLSPAEYARLIEAGKQHRALTAHLRTRGAMRAVITTTGTAEEAVKQAASSPPMEGSDFVKEVTTKSPYLWDPEGLESGDWDIPSPSQNREPGPDGVFLSNGPGDPAALDYIHKEVKELIGKKPIFAICLGHQILGHAYGGKTFKLKFGHRGGNQPVKDLRNGKVSITSQNHGFAIDPSSLPSNVEVTHINLNDGTVEGMRHREAPVLSVQYHPEAAPGPHDAKYFFAEFARMIETGR